MLLFFALYPEADIAKRIDETRKILCRRNGTSPSFVRTDRLHITLFPVKGFDHEVPSFYQQQALKTGEIISAQTAAFDIILNQASGFSGSGGENLVLTTDKLSEDNLKKLHQQLKTHLRKGFIASDEPSSFQPHLTLSYGHYPIQPQLITPIKWNAQELRLIISEQGKTIHRVIGSWKLGA